jgi:hypothetical protein
MEKMIALLLLVFTIGLLVGEDLRDHLYGERIGEQETVPRKELIPGPPDQKKGKQWRRYSGLSSCSSRSGLFRIRIGGRSSVLLWLRSTPWFFTLSQLMSELQNGDAWRRIIKSIEGVRKTTGKMGSSQYSCNNPI